MTITADYGGVWLDPDGKHLWFRHHCGGVMRDTMLPTTWRVAPGTSRVEPSLRCTACGFHEFAALILPPIDWCHPAADQGGEAGQ